MVYSGHGILGPLFFSNYLVYTDKLAGLTKIQQHIVLRYLIQIYDCLWLVHFLDRLKIIFCISVEGFSYCERLLVWEYSPDYHATTSYFKTKDLVPMASRTEKESKTAGAPHAHFIGLYKNIAPGISVS